MTAAVPNNLPLQLSSFIGREQEIAEVKRLLESARLVTLTGAGGCGKTRLALEVAAALYKDGPSAQLCADGVWLVELAPLSDPALVVSTAAAALGVHEQTERPITALLADYLRERNLLLVVDNCEYLIETCANLIEAWLQRSPYLRVLATSREPHNIEGETVHVVSPLTAPPLHAGMTANGVASFESVRLFVMRAQAGQPRFSLTDANAPAVAHVCEVLAGMPLAIELAAARLNMLSVEQIAVKLDNVFALLVGGRRTALARQQTLRATLDWSYGLLDEAEQIVFRRLAVFASGWTLEAAEAVCGSDTLEIDRAINLLAQLVQKSMVVAEQRTGGTRYRMLEPIRQYAAGKLAQSGEKDQQHRKHLEYFAGLAETAEPLFLSPEQIRWFNRFDDDRRL